MNAYINRAFTHSSNWAICHDELDRVTKVLVNNGFSKVEVQNAIHKKMENWHKEEPPPKDDKPPPIVLYYKNHMSDKYVEDEKVIKDIIRRGVKSTTPEQDIKLVIYYKTRKTSELVVRNNPIVTTTDLKKSSVVYEYSCPLGDCKLLSKYIGMTETSLSRRLTCHLTAGAPKQHTILVHGEKLTRAMLVDNTSILAQASDKKRLQFLEAIFITEKKPSLNIQSSSFDILPSNKIKKNKTAERKEDVSSVLTL
jgi:hypothetical protein